MSQQLDQKYTVCLIRKGVSSEEHCRPLLQKDSQMRRWHTLGSILRGVVCLMKDLMTPLRPSVFGVIISIWFFCTAWRKDLMWGLIVCRLTTRNIKLKLGKCYRAQHYPRTGTWQRRALHSDFSWEERASWLDFLQQYLVLCVWYSGVIWTNFNVPLDVTAGI